MSRMYEHRVIRTPASVLVIYVDSSINEMHTEKAEYAEAGKSIF